MGVAGLQGYLERYCEYDGGFSRVDFPSMVSHYRERSNKTPIIIFDTASCLRHIYSKSSDDFLCGGQLKQYIEMFERIYKKITDLGAECVFFTDGSPPPERLGIWTDRRDREYEKTYGVIRLLSDNEFDEAEKKATDIRPISLFAVLLAYMQAKKIKIIQTVSEADDEIMQYIADNEIFAVIGQDSDFVICEGIKNYLSIQHFDFDKMSTRLYDAAALQKRFSLQKHQIPLLATLCGNDIVSSEMLRPFHLRLLQRERNYHRFSAMDFLPRGALIPKICEWIQVIHRHMRSKTSVEEMAAEASKAANLRDKTHLFLKSLKSYQLPPKTKPDSSSNKKRREWETDDAVTQNWTKIIDRINDMFRHEHLSHLVHCVATRCAGFFSVPIQYHIEPDHPSTAKSATALRQRLYGILLKERPKSGDAPLRVEEYIFSQPGQTWPSYTHPTYPSDHPGLLKLWSDDEPMEEKWRMLCWGVSDKVSQEEVLKLTPELQAPALALFYMIHEAKLKVSRWEVEAFVCHLVRLKATSGEELSSMKVRPHSPLAVHLGNVYQVICMLVYNIAAACGYPTGLHHHAGFFFYDGKLFQETYAKLSRGVPASGICVNPEELASHSAVLKFLYPSA